MSTSGQELLELIYANKLLAKTVDEIDSQVAALREDIQEAVKAQAQQSDSLEKDIEKISERVASLTEKIEDLAKVIDAISSSVNYLPMILANKLDELIDKRASNTFEDLRSTIDEMRNKLWSIKREVDDSKQLALSQSKTNLPAIPDDDKHDSVVIKKGKFKLTLPIGPGTLKVLKAALYVILGASGTAALGGGIWTLIDKLKAVLGHG